MAAERPPRSRISAVPIVRAHVSTLLVDGQLRGRDAVEQYGMAITAGTVLGLFDARISETTGAAIMVFTGLLAAFLFALTVQLLDRAANWSENPPRAGAATVQYGLLLEQLSANAGYAGLVSIAGTGAALVSTISSSGLIERFATAATTSLLVHLLATLLLVMQRVFLLTRARVRHTTSGVDL